MAHKDEAMDDAAYAVRKLLTMNAADAAANHRWISEASRWQELVFSLMTRVTLLPEDQVRQLTSQLHDLDLLAVSALAKIDHANLDSLLKDKIAQRIIEVLMESGVPTEEAHRAVITISEAAVGLQKHFKGKIQLYLRSDGERMLREVENVFHFSQIVPGQVRTAFVYWLQNVLNMPLSLRDDTLSQFCEARGIAPEALVQAADDLDLNLALLDDLIISDMGKQRVSKTG